ncbi:MAG: sirohydrochlorin chelatase [Tabrizicola sp.]
MQNALIVAHGQPSDPGPAARTLEGLARRVAGLLPGWQISAATLAEPGALSRAVEGSAAGLVFPLFMAGGWFTRVNIPGKLAEAGAKVGPGGWTVLEPFGCDPAVHDLCVRLVQEAGGEEVILAAHGSFKSSAPSDIACHVADRIAQETGARVRAGFIDQAPQLSTLAGFGDICLPFFAAEGGHVADDIPAALDAAGFRGRILPPVGVDPRVPGIIAAALMRGTPVCARSCRWARPAG